MPITSLRLSIGKLLHRKSKGGSYTTVASSIARDKPRAVIQVIALGRNNRDMLPKYTNHIITLTETATPVTIVYAEGTLYVLE